VIRIRWNTNRQAWEVVEDLRVLASFSSLDKARAWMKAEIAQRENAA
jgi:hypothetical protein